MTTKFFTSESVTEGHPDKLADRVSDAILDAILQKDTQARVAVETVATKGLIHVVGEVTTTAYVDIPGIIRKEVAEIGYNDPATSFDANSCGVSVSISEQSPDIYEGVFNSLESRKKASVDSRDEQGAGDQGLMFGYANSDTTDLMPLPIWLSHKLAKKLSEVRKNGEAPGLYPDGKTQVTIEYDAGTPIAIESILVSTQHSSNLTQGEIEELVKTKVVDPVLSEAQLGFDPTPKTLLINPSGRFVLGGPAGDSGVTGRKIIVDTYGGYARHGGGAFSGKDPSKVDRSASYAARWIAKNIVASGLAKEAEVQLSYAIGQATPVSLSVETNGSAKVSDEILEKAIREVFDLRPLGIIEDLELLNTDKIKYVDTSAYGHFGREGFTWEETNKVEELLEAVRIVQA